MVIGTNSPAVASILYMTCRIGNVSIHKAVIPALAFILLAVVPVVPVMLVTTFVPEPSLFLPRVLGLL
ncbi:hypothetical protein [Marinobacterium sedimentorum]|uniref:hypothetical protein n=1 Tax=Marinobacterium sedimentorum TaxID=2927804 RepID=UPI0020C6806A|nr:hypothetical protein [Marinobacterium sedimentorum]MCP8687204.1 hypothetical protein [Marinobacterium sedimentorum]